MHFVSSIYNVSFDPKYEFDYPGFETSFTKKWGDFQVLETLPTNAVILYGTVTLLL